MKQRDARRKRSRPSPSGTDGFRIPKTGSDKRSGGSIFARRERISRENPGDQESVVAATPVRRSFPIRGYGGGGGTLRGNRDGKTQKRATNSYVQDIYIYPVGDVLTCSWGLDSRTRRTVSQRCLSAGRTYKPPSRLSSAAWCCVSLRKKNG